jgi:hypothetical protein
MKFSTETIEEITQVMVKEFEQQLEKGKKSSLQNWNKACEKY